MRRYLEEDDIIYNDNDEEELEILNELEDDEEEDDKDKNNITNVPYHGDSSDDIIDIDPDIVVIEDDSDFIDDFVPSTADGFTIDDLSRKVRRSLTNSGEDINKLSQDEIEALVGYDNRFGHNSLLDPYIFLQNYRQKKSKNVVKESIGEDADIVQAYYDTLELAREFFDGTDNNRILQLIDQLLDEIKPYTNM